jgi:hypothetical protein
MYVLNVVLSEMGRQWQSVSHHSQSRLERAARSISDCRVRDYSFNPFSAGGHRS